MQDALEIKYISVILKRKVLEWQVVEVEMKKII